MQRPAGRSFKKTIDNEDTRRSREETALQIRKSKKDARLAKRRQMPTGGLGPMTGSDPNTPLRNTTALANLENLPEMIAGVSGNDPALQLECTTQFRRLLSIEKNPPIQQVIASGVVPRFVEFLNRDDNPPLQFEAAWALTYVTKLLPLELSHVFGLQQHCVWYLGAHQGCHGSWGRSDLCSIIDESER